MNTLVWVVLITLISGVGGTGLGGLVSACIRKDSKRIVSLLLSFAAGAMIYVVVEELIPESSQGSHSNLGTIFFSLGFTLMLVLDVALGA